MRVPFTYPLALAVHLSVILARSSNSHSYNEGDVQHWLYSSELDDKAEIILNRPEIVGAQVLHRWRQLEPEEGKYDFSAIHRDLATVGKLDKKLWIQIQDRTFSVKNDPVPIYMKTPYYNKGSVPACDGEHCDDNLEITGWVTQQWNPNVRRRFQSLIAALSEEFDGKIYGLNFPETSIGIDKTANGFTGEGYFRGTLENAAFGANAFKESYVVQYVNFWPDGWNNENNRFTDSFDYFAQHGVGVGGPDLIPYKPGQVKNSYPYLTKYEDKVPITVIAVQEPDLKQINPRTGAKFTKDEFMDYAVNVLKVKVIFWAASTPWLSDS